MAVRRTSRTSALAAGLALAAVSLLAPTHAHACSTVPAAVRDLDIPRYYDDAGGTSINPGLKAAHAAATAPLVAFVRTVTSEADRSLKSAVTAKQKSAAQCALAAMETWGRAGAWLGRVNQQGEYQRKWDLAGVALAYVKVKSHATPAQRAAIEGWLDRVGGAARAFFDDPRRKRNNHWYWLGLALAGTATATGNEAHWATARAIMMDAARDIDAAGGLPMEMARGPRALHYHAFSAMPLVMMAEIAAARGEDWYEAGNRALDRLVALTVRGFAEPAAFERLAGVRQELTASSAGAGWLVLYAHRFPGRVDDSLVPMRTGHRLLGGDVIALMQRLQP